MSIRCTYTLCQWRSGVWQCVVTVVSCNLVQAFGIDCLVPIRQEMATSPRDHGELRRPATIALVEARRPHKKKARSHNTGASVEESSASAIAKSHGIGAPWDDISRRGRDISINGGDRKVYHATIVKGRKLAVLKFIFAACRDKDATETAMARGHHITHVRSPEHRSVVGHIHCWFSL